MTKGRRAPKQGYDFAAKRQYRRHVWNCFKRVAVGARHAQALLMPSKEGDEIEVAIAKGFRMSNLHVVDKNPAIVARLTCRFPGIHTYGVSAARACERIKSKGITLDCANFDFTSCISDKLSREWSAIMSSGVFNKKEAFVAVTLLRGRESRREKGFFDIVSQFTPPWVEHNRVNLGRYFNVRDEARIEGMIYGVICDAGCWYSVDRVGTYLSPCGQTMLWAVIRMSRPEDPSLVVELRQLVEEEWKRDVLAAGLSDQEVNEAIKCQFEGHRFSWQKKKLNLAEG